MPVKNGWGRYVFTDLSDGTVYRGAENFAKAFGTTAYHIRRRIDESDDDTFEIEGHKFRFGTEVMENPRSVPCICLETGEVFASAIEAAQKIGSCAELVRRHLRGEIPHAHHHHFRKILRKREIPVYEYC